jgi:SAM-dependent methyltransferase
LSAKSSRYSFKGLLTEFLTQQRFKAVSAYLRGDILDIGCGYGRIVPHLPAGSTYVGVDSGSEILPYLRRTYPSLEFYQLDLDEDTMQLGRQFDTILMLAVVEHLSQPRKVVCQALEHLKPDGRLLITTPSPIGDRIHHFGARLGLFSRFAADDHETIFDLDLLQELLESCGLQIERYRKFLLGGNQLFVCAHRKN